MGFFLLVGASVVDGNTVMRVNLVVAHNFLLPGFNLAAGREVALDVGLQTGVGNVLVIGKLVHVGVDVGYRVAGLLFHLVVVLKEIECDVRGTWFVLEEHIGAVKDGWEAADFVVEINNFIEADGTTGEEAVVIADL